MCLGEELVDLERGSHIVQARVYSGPAQGGIKHQETSGNNYHCNALSKLTVLNLHTGPLNTESREKKTHAKSLSDISATKTNKKNYTNVVCSTVSCH